MKLVVLALFGCFVAAKSASLSDATASFLSDSGKKSFDEKVSLDSIEFDINDEAKSSENIANDNINNDDDDDVKREKRSGLGSGSFFTGIGSAILGKVAEASKGISVGSSDSRANQHEYESVEYGAPVHNYDESNFDIWSFKKAILNTLFQALKAIGGGVIALKGKLIKGGGIVVSAKGNLISAKGEAISHLGRQIAASAILTPPKTAQSYVYEAAPVHAPSGHESYGGHLPEVYNPHGGYAGSSESFGHSGYAAPSDDADNPGLMIFKSLKGGSGRGLGVDSHDDVSPSSSPLSSLKDAKLGIIASIAKNIENKKKEAISNVLGKIAGASSSSSSSSKNSLKGEISESGYEVSDSYEQIEHKEVPHPPSPSYGPPPGGFDNIINKEESHNDDNNSGIFNSDQIIITGEKLLTQPSIGSITVGHNIQQNNGPANYQQQYNPNPYLGYGTTPLHQGGGDNNFNQFMNSEISALQEQLKILQSYQQNSMYNNIRDFNNIQQYNSHSGNFLRRNGRAGFLVPNHYRIFPGIRYPLRGHRLYRI